MQDNSGLGKLAGLLVVIGAINWGLVGIGAFMSRNLNVVNILLGNWPTVEWIIYILIGLSGLVMVKECLK